MGVLSKTPARVGLAGYGWASWQSVQTCSRGQFDIERNLGRRDSPKLESRDVLNLFVALAKRCLH